MPNNLHYQKAVIKTDFFSLGLSGHYIQIMRLEIFQRCCHQVRVNTCTGSWAYTSPMCPEKYENTYFASFSTVFLTPKWVQGDRQIKVKAWKHTMLNQVYRKKGIYQELIY